MKRTANRTRPKVMNAGIVVLARALDTKALDTKAWETKIPETNLGRSYNPVAAGLWGFRERFSNAQIWPFTHSCDSTAATAVMFRIPRAVTDGVRICAGHAEPIR